MRVVGQFGLPGLVRRAPVHEHDFQAIVESEHSAALVLQEADNETILRFVEFHVLASQTLRDLAFLHTTQVELSCLSCRYPKRDKRLLVILCTHRKHLGSRVDDLLGSSVEIRHQHLRLPSIDGDVRSVLRDSQIADGCLDAQLESLQAREGSVGVLGDVETCVVVDVVQFLSEHRRSPGVIRRAVAALLDPRQVFGRTQEETVKFRLGVLVTNRPGLGDGSAVVVAGTDRRHREAAPRRSAEDHVHVHASDLSIS